MSPPKATAPSTPSQTGQPQYVMNTPVMTPHRIMPVPIERSIPPETMTKVVPRARIPVTVAAMRMPTRLLGVKKYGLAMEKNAMITMRLTKASNCCIEPPIRARIASRARFDDARAVVVDAGVGVAVEVTSSPFLRR